MTRNVGTIDRAIRIVLGLILIAFALGWIFPGTGFNWIGWLGVVLIATALVEQLPGLQPPWGPVPASAAEPNTRLSGAHGQSPNTVHEPS